MRKIPKRPVVVCSFAFKNGVPKANFVFDMRGLPNPFYVKELKELTGLDRSVRHYVFSFAQTRRMYKNICDLMEMESILSAARYQEPLIIAFGCTGGQHRSVSMAERVAHFLRKKGLSVMVRHRELERKLENQ